MAADLPALPARLKAWAATNPVEVILALVFLLLVAGFYAFYPAYGSRSAMGMLESSWNDETDYGHGYMVGPIGIALLGWKFWKSPMGPREANAWLGLPVLILGLMLWVFAYRVLQWRVAIGSFTVVLWGAVWYLFGWRTAKLAALPIFLLCLAVPVPGMIQATNGLQVLATKIGYEGSKLFAVPCVQAGTNIQSSTTGKWGFDIAGGCSGIRSLMAMVLIAAVYVYVIDLPVWRKALVFAAAIPLAILVNSIRIVTILVLAEYVSKDFAAGIYHSYASFFIFPLGLLGMLAVHHLLTLDLRVKQKVVRRMTTPNPGPN